MNLGRLRESWEEAQFKSCPDLRQQVRAQLNSNQELAYGFNCIHC